VGHSDLGLHQCSPWWVTLISGYTNASVLPLASHYDLGLDRCCPLVNKMSYFVCNEPGEAWIRLPAVTPAQIDRLV